MKNLPQKLNKFSGVKIAGKLRLITQIFSLLLIGISTLNNVQGQCTNPYSQTIVGGALGSNGSTTITMLSNQSGVYYQLKLESTDIGSYVVGSGNGGAINWTVSSIGTYSVWSLAQGNFCSKQVSGTVTVTAYVPPPPIIASLTVVSGISGADGFGPFQNICAGDPVSVTVSPVHGGTYPTYQWFKNNSIISGAIGTSYSSTDFVNGDKLSVTMTSNDPDANPKTATVSINIYATNKVTPTVSLTPSNASNPSICAGTNLTFTASTTSPCSYKWKINNVEQTGEINNTFSTSSLTNGQTVSVEISTTNACQTTNFASNATTVTVNPNLPVSVSISGATSLCDGFGSFSALANNGGSNAGVATSYQWKVKPAGSSTFSDVTNRSTGTGIPEYMYIPSTSLNDGDALMCVFTSNATCPTGNPANSNTLTVTKVNPVTPGLNVISGISGGTDGSLYQNICSGGTASVTISPVNGGPNPTYQWYKNSIAISGANSTFYSSTSFLNGEKLSVTMSSSASCVKPITPGVTITINVNPLPSQPGTPAVSYNCSSATLTPPSPPSQVTYYWQNSASGTFAGTGGVNTVSSGGTYYLRAMNSQGCWSSGASSILVNPLNTTVPAQINVQSCIGNGTITYSVVNSGDYSGYNWFQSGNIVLGTDFTQSVSANAGSKITCSVNLFNNNNCINTAVAEGYAYNTPVILSTSDELNKGASVTLSVNKAMDDIPFSSIQWKKENVAISGATQESLVVSQPGNYTVQVGMAGISGTFTSLPKLIMTQGQSRNYIVSHTILADNVKDENSISTLPVEDAQESYTYLDGIGRPSQTVITQGSPTKKDIVQNNEYDGFGRETVKYLPYTSGNDGSFKKDAKTAQADFYKKTANIAADNVPYALSVFESSPLNRLIEQGAVGIDWQPTDSSGNSSGHTTKLTYETNGTNDVLLMKVNDDNSLAFATTGGDSYNNKYYYHPGELIKNVTKNENYTAASGNLNTSEEFKDKRGNVILKRTYVQNNLSISSVETYFIYDDLGMLRFVLPPVATDSISLPLNPTTPMIKRLGYYYEYDPKQRLILKQLPGAAPVYVVYDNRDRPVLTQDGTLRYIPDGSLRNQWMFTKYDALNRPILTGLYNDSRTRDVIQEDVDKYTGINLYEVPGAGALGYSVRSFPKQSIADYFTVTYYDFNPEWDASLYYFRGDSAKIDTYKGADGSNYNTKLIGQVTGRSVKVLTPDGSGIWLSTLYFYDDKYRVIQTIANNHLVGGSDIVSAKYDFAGKVLETRNEQHVMLRGTKPFVLYYHTYNTYDHAGRLLKTQQRIAGNTYNNYVTLDSLKYNETGQLIEKNLHGKLQSIDYKYNIRGWLQSINNPNDLSSDGTGDAKSDLFGMKLLYNDTIGGLNWGDEKQYNGNIAAVKWRLDADVTTKGYAFRYDGLNRILHANFGLAKDKWNNPQYDVTGRNAEPNIGYDKNGNITSMGCKDSTSSNGIWLDNLHYRYFGNQLRALGKGVNAATTYDNYLYYPSGNLQRDEYKNINVYYNELNLPSRVLFGVDYYIDYLYNAEGVKLRKEVYINNLNTTSTDYLGNIAYTDGAFDYLITSEGRVTRATDTSHFVYEYHLKDHLGNTRVAFEAISANSLKTVQRADYYPFGLQFKSNASGAGNNKYLYNGKEMQNDTILTASLGWYDYGARFYDPQIGRWNVIDPVIEKGHYNYTPYAYVYNNPIGLIDPTGLDSTYYNESGKQIYEVNGDHNSSKSYVIKTTQSTADLYTQEERDAGVAGNSNPISQDAATATEDQIKKGNLKGNHMGNLVEIQSEGNRQQMNGIVSSDDGKGGTKDANNRENGGTITGQGNIQAVAPGRVGNPRTDLEVSIILPVLPGVTRGTFHDHPSGDVTNVTVTQTAMGTSTQTQTWSWMQAPSRADISNAGAGTTNYVYGKRSRIVYIFNNSGVIATMPAKKF